MAVVSVQNLRYSEICSYSLLRIRKNSAVYVNTQQKLACNEEHFAIMHCVDPSSVRSRATEVTVKLLTTSRRNSSTMFYGHREAAFSLQNSQYAQPVSQLVPSSPAGYRKLIREAHRNAVPSDCEERQTGSGHIPVRR
jgi:hypothetical protein